MITDDGTSEFVPAKRLANRVVRNKSGTFRCYIEHEITSTADVSLSELPRRLSRSHLSHDERGSGNGVERLVK